MLVFLMVIAAFLLAALSLQLPVVLTSASAGFSMPGFGGAIAGPSADALAALQSLRDLLKNLIVLMAALTNFAEDNIIKHFYRTGSYTKPTVCAHALFTATPGEAGGGTEVSGGSYARVDLPPLDANWRATSSGDGTTNNLSAITFPAPTANWGVVTSTAQLDATSAGNMQTYGALTVSKTINNGDAAPAFAIAAFSFQIDN